MRRTRKFVMAILGLLYNNLMGIMCSAVMHNIYLYFHKLCPPLSHLPPSSSSSYSSSTSSSPPTPPPPFISIFQSSSVCATILVIPHNHPLFLLLTSILNSSDSHNYVNIHIAAGVNS